MTPPMSPQDEREAIARIVHGWSSNSDLEWDWLSDEHYEPGEGHDCAKCHYLQAADAILALRQPAAEYRRGVEAEGVTSDSDVYKHTFYGILNAQGEFWTPIAYPSKHEADNALDRFIGAEEARFGRMRSTHRIVPVRVQLTALLPESTKGEGRD